MSELSSVQPLVAATSPCVDGKRWIGLRASHGIIASCAAAVRTANKDDLGIAPFSPDRQQRRPVT